jgi:hypothetical protein
VGWRADNLDMSRRSLLVMLASVGALMVPGALAPASAYAEPSVGTPGQIAWVRSAATRFVTAELAGDAANACAVLNAPLRATEHGRTCTQRWTARIARLLREPGSRAGLRTQKHAIATAAVVVHGNVASIDLPAPLMGGANRFVWSENCWMLAN